MHIKLIIFILSSLLIFTTAKNQNTIPGAHRIDFNVRRGDSRDNLSPRHDSMPKLIKRDTPDGSVEMTINNKQTFYEAVLEIGSNKNQVGVLVDTGSSDLWVMSHDVDCFAESTLNQKRDNNKHQSQPRDVFFGLGTGVIRRLFQKRQEEEEVKPPPPPTKTIHEKLEYIVSTVIVSQAPGTLAPAPGGGNTDNRNDCTSLGSFTTEDSTSFKQNSSIPFFQIEYADGTEAVGIWGHDNVVIGDVQINDLSFAIANKSSSDVSVLGIGLPGLETTNQFGITYENLPLKMKSQGLINKNVFSLYLNDMSTDSGTILFGAIDHAKYQGNLVTLPIVKTTGFSQPVRLQVKVNSINITSGSQTISAMSTANTVVLDSGSTLSYVYPSVLTALGTALGGTYSQQIGAYVVSCSVPSSVALQIQFGSNTITVPLTDLILQVSTNQCVLGILAQSSSSPYMLFGDNILRNAYVVFDLDDYEVSIAQVNFTDNEDIEVITDSVPTSGSSGTSSSSSSSSSSSGSSSSSNSNSNNKSSGSRITSNAICIIIISILVSLLM